MDWLQRITTELASKAGADVDELTLSPDVRRQILDVARVASHTSGDRINAPLLCYVLGMTRTSGLSLADAIAVVEAHADEATDH